MVMCSNGLLAQVSIETDLFLKGVLCWIVHLCDPDPPDHEITNQWSDFLHSTLQNK